MLLAIDAGNTNIVFAVHDGKDVRAEWRAVTETTRTADEYAVLLSPLLALNGLTFDDIDSAIIATVVPAALFDLRLLCRRYLKCEPLVVGDPDLDLGIEVHIDRPEAVGADRLVNTVAAHERYKGALIVVDFGTATTFDIVSAKGDYEGGVIAPGANLSAEALHQGAAMLPRVAIQRTQSVIGKDTDSGHAVRPLLGLCRPDRRPGRAHQGRVWRAHDGDRRPAASPTCSTSRRPSSIISIPISPCAAWC